MPCNYEMTRGMRQGQLCGKGCANREYCARHRKMLERRPQRAIKAEEDKAQFLGYEQEPMTTQDKIKKSVFAITINSQKNVERMTPILREKFLNILNHLFTQDNILDFVDCREGFPCLRNSPECLVQMTADYKIEVGEQYGKIHAHALVEIDHRSVIQVNLRALKSLFREYMGYSLHVNVQAKPQLSSGAWVSYLNKKIIPQ